MNGLQNIDDLLAQYQANPMAFEDNSQPVNTQSLSNDIQVALGAKQPAERGVTNDILASRFNTEPEQPTMSMLPLMGGTAPSYNDYLSSAISSLHGNFNPATDYAANSFNDQLKRLSALSDMQKNIAMADMYSKGLGGGVISAFNPVTGQMEFVPKMQAASGQYMPPPPAGKKYVDGKLVASEPSTRDQMRLAEAEKGAQAASSAGMLLNQANTILGRYSTNKAAPVLGKVGQLGAVIGLGDKQAVTDYENLKKLSTNAGIEALQMFGGNDTNLELQTAISASFDADSLVETNLSIIKNKMIAASILQEKPAFMEEWLAKTGSLSAIDPETGMTFSRAWLQKQDEMMKASGFVAGAKIDPNIVNNTSNENVSAGGGEVGLREGQTAINRSTGERIIVRGGKWQRM
jgi:hypothetical protein